MLHGSEVNSGCAPAREREIQTYRHRGGDAKSEKYNKIIWFHFLCALSQESETNVVCDGVCPGCHSVYISSVLLHCLFLHIEQQKQQKQQKQQ